MAKEDKLYGFLRLEENVFKRINAYMKIFQREKKIRKISFQPMPVDLRREKKILSNRLAVK